RDGGARVERDPDGASGVVERQLRTVEEDR
ncbi:MAG: hypothetical protein AVDCRST_MAG41-409, partial [uncultured Corynebacteriales bacterium]